MRDNNLQVLTGLFVLGIGVCSAAGSGSNSPEKRQQDTDGPLPRPTRKRSRRRSDRGLPADDRLEGLARLYLEKQQALFPDLMKSGHLPEADPEIIAAMVHDFKARHGGRSPDALRLAALREALEAMPFGAGYFRYSCDNSNPTSIDDQMINCLNKAASDDAKSQGKLNDTSAGFNGAAVVHSG